MSDEITRVETAAPPERGTGTVVGGRTGTIVIEHDEADWLNLEEWTGGDAEPVEVGSVIRERFELLSVIGEGTMGVVYRALDLLHQEMHDSDPYVAIKILSEQFKRHPNALISLQREVRKSQVLAHENIITVHSFDRDGSVVYMTMELLGGSPLRAVINQNSQGLPASRAVPMIAGMARALSYAHRNGIVHSDFKPSNVFLTDKEKIKVLDFGVARVSPVGQPADARDTAVEYREVGGMTPAYASPEMLRGEDPVPADDVFSLAIVAFELSTGRHPFDREAVDENKLEQVRSTMLPGLTRWQRKALRRAFSRDRDARHANAGEFLREFEATNRMRPRAWAGLGVAVALVPFAFVSMRGPESLPAVSLENLPDNVRQELSTSLREGEMALRFGAAGINDAYFYYSRAFELHPNNPDAVVGLETVADSFLDSIRTADVGTQREVFELLYCQDHLRGYAPVRATCEDLLGSECAAIARRCASIQPQN